MVEARVGNVVINPGFCLPCKPPAWTMDTMAADHDARSHKAPIPVIFSVRRRQIGVTQKAIGTNNKGTKVVVDIRTANSQRIYDS